MLRRQPRLCAAYCCPDVVLVCWDNGVTNLYVRVESPAMRAKKPLTDRGIGALPPAPLGKRHLAWDALVPGLAVRVTDRGQRSFVLIIRYPGSRHPAPRSLGRVGAISLEDARTKAREWLKQISSGIDPAQTQATA